MAGFLSNRDGGKLNEKGLYYHVDKLFSGEVITGFQVTQQASPGMGITVNLDDDGAASAMIPSGNTYPYMVFLESDENVGLAVADGSNPRIDLIVAYVDLSVVSSATANNPGAVLIDNVTGTPAGSPSVPNAAAIEAVIGASNPYIILAQVAVAAGATTITNTNITDVRSFVSVGSSVANDGWSGAGETWSVSSGYNKGNKEYEITVAGDKTGKYSPGMRIKVSRGTTPPTQSTDLESGSSQYASKSSPTGIVFTDDFTCEAWIKLESYTGSSQNIVSRYDGADGWLMQLDSSGRLSIFGDGAANRQFVTNQSIPLGIWTHVAAGLDMSAGTATMYINGTLVASASVGASGTSLTQGGNLQVGAAAASGFFDGKIMGVRVWDAIRTATQIRDNMNQQLVGNETNLVAYFKLDGNFNDSTANANNLTAQNSAVATNLDNPMHAIEYGIIHKATLSGSNTILTVFTGTDYNVPNLTLSSPSYSAQRSPYGFPAGEDKWYVETSGKTNGSQSTPASGTWYNLGSFQLSIPTGSWRTYYKDFLEVNENSASTSVAQTTLSNGASTAFDVEFISGHYHSSNVSSIQQIITLQSTNYLSLTSQTMHYLNSRINAANVDTIASRGDLIPTTIRAVSAYV